MKTKASAPGATQTRGINPALAAIAILMMALIGTTQAVTLDTGNAKQANVATPEGPAYTASDAAPPVFTPLAWTDTGTALNSNVVFGANDNPAAVLSSTPQTVTIQKTDQNMVPTGNTTRNATNHTANATNTGPTGSGLIATVFLAPGSAHQLE